MGDEVDVRMFEKSGYSFEVPEDTAIKAKYTQGAEHLEALKINQYESKYRSMSVLVKDVAREEYSVFVKGAPEKLLDLAVNKIPNFDDNVFSLSLQGLRLIAFGYKRIQDPKEYMSKSREDFE